MKGFRLGLFISLNEIIRSTLIHLHKVGLFLLLLLLIETTYFIYTSKNDLLMSCCIVWYSTKSQAKFRWAGNCCQGFLNLLISYANKQSIWHFLELWFLQFFWKLQIVSPSKINLVFSVKWCWGLPKLIQWDR